jgi:hypothetical protein
MPLIGRKDAWGLAAIGAGIAAANPALAGDPGALLGLLAPAAGGAWFGWKQARAWLDVTDTQSREGFILPSDPCFPECMPQGTGLRMGYTTDQQLPIDIADESLMRHTALIGQSGVGKTVLGEFLLWQQAVRGGGFIFIDAKLDVETCNRLAYMMHILGRSDDFYVLNVDKPENSNSYNPILRGDADEVASRLLNLLPTSENNPGADFYRQSANHALTVITGALKAAHRRYHFSDLAILLQSARALGELERIVPPGSPERMSVQVFLDQFRKRSKEGTQLDINRLKEVLGGMSGRIATFAQGKFGKVFNCYTPEIDLTDIVTNNRCCYVMLPTMGKEQAALNLGKMVLSDLRTAVYHVQALPRSQRPNPPFLVFADEMGSYVMGPGLARLFEQARSANVAMIPAFQSFANLSVVSPDFCDLIVQNTWQKAFFKFSSKDSPQDAAEIIGMTKRFAYTLSLSEQDRASADNLRATPKSNEATGDGVSESYRESEEYRVTPDQLKALPMGECFLMSGARTFHVRTPMIRWPTSVPDYQVTHHPVQLPNDEFGLDFESRYREFLLAAEDEGRTASPREGASAQTDDSGVP